MPNFKRNLRESIEQRHTESISNIRLPALHGDDTYYKPNNLTVPIRNSDSLKFKKTGRPTSRLRNYSKRENEKNLDNTLKNIRHDLVSKGLKLEGVSVQMID